MVDRVHQRHDLKPERLIADTAYGSGPMLGWLVDRGIAPHIPVIDKSGRSDGTFERADFTYDTENDAYICPGGKELKQYRRAFTKPREPRPDKDGILRYRARKSDCEACTLKNRCCPKEPQRKVTRSGVGQGSGTAAKRRRNLTRLQEKSNHFTAGWQALR